MKRFSIFLIGFLTACTSLPKRSPQEEARVQRDVQATALQYFIEQANPTTGLVRDRAQNFKDTPNSERLASIAATGFGMAVIANAAKRGQVSMEFARHYVLKTLKFTQLHIGRRKGWMYHFVDWETGSAANHSEFSTVDTAFFVAGALYAAQVLSDKEISTLAETFYRDLDFQDALTDGGTLPKKKTLSMAYWTDGSGYRQAQWDMYAEQQLLLLLGLGHPTQPLPADTWLAWNRQIQQLPNGTAVMGADGPLFLHQYTQLFVDFRGFQDGFPNYFSNSILATQWQRELMERTRHNATLSAGFWGFSAGEAPEDSYLVWDATHFETVVCLGCTVASAMFVPQILAQDMVGWLHGPYAKDIWGRYGFTDSIDIAHKWFSPEVLGITVGAEYLALANTRPETSVWRDFMKIPAIQTALERASRTTHSLAAAAH